MKKVLAVYDSLTHKPKLQNLTSFYTSNLYEYEDMFVRDTKDIFNLFIETKPNILIIDVLFEDNKILDLVENIYTDSKGTCRLIVISPSMQLRDMLFKSRIPDRIFPSNIATDVLAYTISELVKDQSQDQKYLFLNLIENFELKPYSPTTINFIISLQFSVANPFLLNGHINNIFYSVSKINNISTEAARKSIYRIIDSVKDSSNKDYIYSIFGNTDLNNISPSRFLEMITWKIRN